MTTVLMSRPAAALVRVGRFPHVLTIAVIAGLLVLASEPTPAEAQGGCISANRLYPEGAIVKPPPRSRFYARGHFVCRNGAWVFVKA